MRAWLFSWSFRLWGCPLSSVPPILSEGPCVPSVWLHAETRRACGGQPGWRPLEDRCVGHEDRPPGARGSSRLSVFDAVTQTLAVEQQQPRHTLAAATSCLGLCPCGGHRKAVSSGLPCRLHWGRPSFPSPAQHLWEPACAPSCASQSLGPIRPPCPEMLPGGTCV